ncbi:unnamed protein product [Allacma fusca]|uniref:Uncharacterized protein n=1 Tax=Allacma fusca TaxID=39272 RepID=A0A8J2NM55_9HEXA|nr:unnamed protein product [Allacma fusca]
MGRTKQSTNGKRYKSPRKATATLGSDDRKEPKGIQSSSVIGNEETENVHILNPIPVLRAVIVEQTIGLKPMFFHRAKGQSRSRKTNSMDAPVLTSYRPDHMPCSSMLFLTIMNTTRYWLHATNNKPCYMLVSGRSSNPHHLSLAFSPYICLIAFINENQYEYQNN